MEESTVASLCEEAREHLENLRVDEGEAAARKALELDPTSDDALALLGIALCRTGHTAEGIEALGQAVVLNPTNITARSNLATARHQAGHLEAARAEWQAVLRLDPDNAKAHSALAVVEWQIQHAAGPPLTPETPAASPLPQSDVRSTAPQTAMPGTEAQRSAGSPLNGPALPQPQPATVASLGQSSPTMIHIPRAAPIPGPALDARGVGVSSRVATGDYDPGGWSLEAIRAILTSPTEFMASQRGHYGLGKPVMFTLINSVIVGVAGTLVALIRMAPALGTSELRGSALGLGAGIVGGMFGMVIGVMFGIVMQAIMAGVIHLIVIIFGGKEPYGGTYRALVYASVPMHLAYIVSTSLIMIHPLLAIPAGLISIAGAVWSIVVAVIGIGVIHVISGCSAFGALFLGGIALVAVILMLSLALGGAMQARRGSGVFTRPHTTIPLRPP